MGTDVLVLITLVHMLDAGIQGDRLLLDLQDNEGLQRVNAGVLLRQLPPHLRRFDIVSSPTLTHFILPSLIFMLAFCEPVFLVGFSTNSPLQALALTAILAKGWATIRSAWLVTCKA